MIVTESASAGPRTVSRSRMAWVFLFLGLLCSTVSKGGEAEKGIVLPAYLISGAKEEININGSYQDLQVSVNGQSVLLEEISGQWTFSHRFENDDVLEIREGGKLVFRKKLSCIPAWFSILPPLLAIALALAFREVISSIFIGIFSGAFIIACFTDGWWAPATALFSLVDRYIIDSLHDAGHLSVIVFSMLIGASVHVISKNGGMKGVVNILSRYARNRRSGQFVTYLLGVLIFFDDYANTLIVGNTMRPVTDRLKISREKLAYLVDSTAAPIAAIAFVTTWIGAELGYIEDGFKSIDGLQLSAYEVFFQSLQFSFYPILTLVFIALLIFMKMDFGPMLSAEERALKREEGLDDEVISVNENEMREFEPEEGTPERWLNAVLPVFIILFVTIFGLISTGYSAEVWADKGLSFFQKMSSTIGNADAYRSLLWGSISGLMTAILLSLVQKLLNLQELAGSVLNGFKTMLPAMVILILAWSLSLVTEDLRTADFLSRSISGNLSPEFVPAVTFVLAALVSFSTGSSWGCMAILYPLVLPLSWSVCMEHGLDHETSLFIFYNTVSTVLAGAVLGDHCSPISDTTILSSLASSCNHIEHVRTQLPYALLVGGVSLVLGTLPTAFGLPSYASLIISIIVLALLIKRFGKVID